MASCLTYGIWLALEVWVMKTHSFKDLSEQLPLHPKVASEMVLVQHCFRMKVVTVQLRVVGLSVAVQIFI
jgi:hypothetical protein